MNSPDLVNLISFRLAVNDFGIIYKQIQQLKFMVVAPADLLVILNK